MLAALVVAAAAIAGAPRPRRWITPRQRSSWTTPRTSWSTTRPRPWSWPRS